MRRTGLLVGLACLSGQALAQGPAAPVLNPVVGIFEGGLQCLMGASAGGEYLDADKAAGALRGGDRYAVFDLGGEIARATGSVPAPGAEPCDWLHEVELSPPPAPGGRAVALAADWSALPDRLTLSSTDQEVYRRAAGAWLHEGGIVDKAPQLTQVIRTDLEGDGVDEVLMTLSNQDLSATFSGRAGAYSSILLRRLRNGALETVPIVSQVFATADPAGLPFVFSVVAVLDLNGDGRSEIVISADYYEGGSLEAYEIGPEGAVRVLECGCGV